MTSATTSVGVVPVKPWRDRSNTIGAIPGKSHGQAQSLRQILDQLPLASDARLAIKTAQGEEKYVPVDDICAKQLSACGLVVRDANIGWGASPAAAAWLESNDDQQLACFLHANVKFFGELLAQITEKTQISDLLDLAGTYGLHWSSADQIHRRIGWFRSLGLLERWGMGHLVVTELGSAFLAIVECAAPEEVGSISDVDDDDVVDLPDVDPLVVVALDGLNQASLLARRTLIGYIPRGRKAASGPDDKVGAVEAIRNFVGTLGDGASVEDFFALASERFAQKRSSFKSSIHSFKHMRMIEMTSFNRYGPTPEAHALLDVGQEVNLVRFFHTRFRFIGELLVSMDEQRTVSDLARIAALRYGCEQIKNSEVRVRLELLAAAGLVERVDWARYRTTTAGRLLTDNLILELPLTGQPGEGADTGGGEVPSDESQGTSLDALISNLRQFSNVGDSSEDFERALAHAFQYFGFRSEHLGGSGKTDVLVTAELAAGDRYRAIVDAKSSGSGVIGENAVKFDAIDEHRIKHDADFALVVGPDFSGRVKEWATNHKVALLAVEELIDFLQRQQATPLTLVQLRGIFQRSDLLEVDEAYDSAAKDVELIGKVVDVLFQEANEEDPVASGWIALDNLHYALRKEITPRPPRAVIEEVLTFLASPMVRAVERDGNKYKLIDAPSNVALRLSGLGSPLGSLTLS